MFSYPCPACGEILFAPVEEVGRRTLCPKCLKPIRIPAPAEEEELQLKSTLAVAVDEPVSVRTEAASRSALLPPLAQTQPQNRSETRKRGASATEAEAVPLPDRGEKPGEPRLKGNGKPTEPDFGAAQPVAAALSVELSTVIVSRLMTKLPPPPPPVYAIDWSGIVCLAVNIIALVMVITGFLGKPLGFRIAAGLGLWQFLLGWGWLIRKGFCRNRGCGGVTLFPPLALLLLLRSGPVLGLRPLGLMLCGGFFLLAGWLGPEARRAVVPTVTEGFSPDSADKAAIPSRTVRHHASLQGRADSLAMIQELEALAKSEADWSALERAAWVEQLRLLLGDQRPSVRAAALTALSRIAPTESREAVLKALRSQVASERSAALRAVRNCPDRELVEVVAERLGDRDDGVLARETLLAIGGRLAEEALLSRLSTDRQLLLLELCDLLVHVGGPDAVQALERMAETGPDLLIRSVAGHRARELSARLKENQTRSVPAESE